MAWLTDKIVCSALIMSLRRGETRGEKTMHFAAARTKAVAAMAATTGEDATP